MSANLMLCIWFYIDYNITRNSESNVIVNYNNITGSVRIHDSALDNNHGGEARSGSYFTIVQVDTPPPYEEAIDNNHGGEERSGYNFTIIQVEMPPPYEEAIDNNHNSW